MLEVKASCTFLNIPDYATDGVKIGFIGGELLMEFVLLKQIYS